MKHARQIITEQRKLQEIEISEPALESYIPFIERHASLEAAKFLVSNSPTPEICNMTALLVESMGYGNDIALESFDTNPTLAVEAAQEENLNAAKKKASDFSSGLMGWIQKTFTARGKAFKELDELIAKVTAVENKHYDLSSADKKKWGSALAFPATFEGALSDFKKTYDVVEAATFKRMEGSLNALKAGTDPSRVYDGLIETYIRTVVSVIPVKVGTPKQGVLGSPIESYIAPHSRIGTRAFFLSANLTDISMIKNQRGEKVTEPYQIAHFFEEISRRTYVFYDEIMSDSTSNMPSSFKEIKNILIAFRDILDDCLNVDSLKRLEKMSKEQNDYIQKMKMSESVLFANWAITNSNFASGSILFKSVDEAMFKILRDMIGWVNASLDAVKE